MSWIEPRKAYTYFNENYQLRPSTKGWFLFDCPVCGGRMTRGVHFGYSITKCFKPCGYKGDIIGYVAFIEDSTYDEARSMLWRVATTLIGIEDLVDAAKETIRLLDTDITLPDGFKPLLKGTGAMAVRARRYMRGRGFDLDELDSEGYGYSDEHHEEFVKDFCGYIIVPFKRSGKLIYYQGRSFVGHDEWRHKNPPTEYVGVGKGDVLFNEEALQLYKSAFIVEGWADAKTLGARGTATQGWSLSDTQKSIYFNSVCNKLIFIPDAGIDGNNGVSFYQKATQVATEFLDSGKRIYIVNLNKEHLSRYGKDVNKIGVDRVMEEYRNTEQLTWGSAMNILTSKDVLCL